jgi:hypothetical protein
MATGAQAYNDAPGSFVQIPEHCTCRFLSTAPLYSSCSTAPGASISCAASGALSASAGAANVPSGFSCRGRPSRGVPLMSGSSSMRGTAGGSPSCRSGSATSFSSSSSSSSSSASLPGLQARNGDAQQECAAGR